MACLWLVETVSVAGHVLLVSGLVMCGLSLGLSCVACLWACHVWLVSGIVMCGLSLGLSCVCGWRNCQPGLVVGGPFLGQKEKKQNEEKQEKQNQNYCAITCRVWFWQKE
eukprot:Trichotokara_eunicae@DN3106_c0_g1_i1.p1